MNRPKLQERAVAYMKIVQNNIDWEYYFEWLEPLLLGVKERKWQRPCISALTFIDHPEYLDKDEDTFPAVKKIATFIGTGLFREAVLMAGIGCLTGETLVHTEFGTKKLIDVGYGEKVLSYNRKTETFEYAESSGVFDVGRDVVYRATVGSHKIRMTANHPVLKQTDNGAIWTQFRDVKKGDLLAVYEDGELVYKPLKGVCRLTVQTVYDLEVYGNHNFVADGFLVSNSGKSFTSQIMILYETHKLLCMKDPHKFFALAKDKDIAIINMGPSAQQAKSVVFNGLANMMYDSKFFKDYSPEILKTEVRFEKRRILIVSGNSKETTPLGKNVYCALLDEAAFFMDNEKNSVAEAIHGQLDQRITSRFKGHGLIMMISSPRYEGDFIMKRLKDSTAVNDKGERIHKQLYSFVSATWKTQTEYLKPEYQLLENHFWFDQRANKIIPHEDWDKVKEVYGREGISYIVDDLDHTVCRFWQVPGKFEAAFLANPEKAKRDFGAIPSLTIEGFFQNPTVIDEMSNPWHQNPIREDGSYIFPQPFNDLHYIHLDLAMNRNGKGDKAAIAMCHIDRWERDERYGELYPIIYVDLVEQIEAGPTGEIEFADVRQKIYDLQDFGFKIGMVTTDGYQSEDMRQILKSKGIDTEYLSIDRSIEPYQMLKTMINMKRIDIYDYEPLKNELKQLELVKGTKVDHPAHSSKDCISGDTTIKLLNGKDVPIRDLLGKEFYVYSSTKEGEIRIGKAWNVHKVGDKEVMRVWLDNGEYIECTDDHEIMMRDGSFLEAKELKEGDSLMPLYTKSSVGNAKSSLNGYTMFQDNKTMKYKYTHQQVAFDVLGFSYGRSKGERKVVHHVDFDKGNNAPENLQIMGWDEHREYHNKVGSGNLKKLWEDPKFREEAKKRASALGKVTGKVNIVKYNKSPERIAKLKERNSLPENQKKWRDTVQSLWSSAEFRDKFIKARSGSSNCNYLHNITVELIYEACLDPTISSYAKLARKLGCGKNTILRRLKKAGVEPSSFRAKYFDKRGENCHRYKKTITKEWMIKEARKYLSKRAMSKGTGIAEHTLVERERKFGISLYDYFGVKNNHKVVRVEHNVRTTDVYDMTVDTYHNFAIGSGVFVHNCADAVAGAIFMCVKHNTRGFGFAS